MPMLVKIGLCRCAPDCSSWSSVDIYGGREWGGHDGRRDDIWIAGWEWLSDFVRPDFGLSMKWLSGALLGPSGFPEPWFSCGLSL